MINSKEVAVKAWEKAIANGWDGKLKYVSFNKGEALVSPYNFIFNHDFAKALWGDPWAFFTEGVSGDTIGGNFINWKGHLINMVVAENPLEYLSENI